MTNPSPISGALYIVTGEYVPFSTVLLFPYMREDDAESMVRHLTELDEGTKYRNVRIAFCQYTEIPDEPMPDTPVDRSGYLAHDPLD